jgi:hypothetical protein
MSDFPDVRPQPLKGDGNGIYRISIVGNSGTPINNSIEFESLLDTSFHPPTAGVGKVQRRLYPFSAQNLIMK